MEMIHVEANVLEHFHETRTLYCLHDERYKNGECSSSSFILYIHTYIQSYVYIIHLTHSTV